MDKLRTKEKLNKVFGDKFFETSVRLISSDEQGEKIEFSFYINKIIDMISLGEWTPTCVVSVNIIGASDRFKLVYNIVGNDFLKKNYITKVDLEHSIEEMIEPFFDGNFLVKIPDESNSITVDI
jgi:hypothetical protein